MIHSINSATHRFVLIFMLAIPASLAIECFKTEIGSTPHPRNCGSEALACRVIVRPYSARNTTAVTDCSLESKESGSFVYDCAVDCPADKKDYHWNEVQCCTSSHCNDGVELSKQKFCYVSSPDGPDDIVECNKPKQCGLNTKTGATSCISSDSCSGDWWCCKGSDCDDMDRWGVFKPTRKPQMKESKDANALTGSLTLSLVLGLAFCAATG